MQVNLENEDEKQYSEILKQWKKTIRKVKNFREVDFQTIKQWLDHPNRKDFIDWKDDNIAVGKPMLLCAIYYERFEIVSLLLDHGANINICNNFGLTAFLLASFRGHLNVLKLIWEKRNVDLNGTDFGGSTALMWASDRGHSDIVEYLLHKGASINFANNRGETALMWASWSGHTNIVTRLLEEGADITSANMDGDTAFTLASHHGHTEVVEVLKYWYDKVKWKTFFDEDELKEVDIEAFKQWIEDVKKESGIDWKDDSIENGRTMLSCAILYKRFDIAKMLLQHGANVNIPNNKGWTSFMYASRRGLAEIVEIMLKMGGDLSLADEEGWTALLIAAHYGHTKTVGLLLGDKNVDITTTDNFGDTALTLASQQGHSSVVEQLLAKGADCKITNNQGRTAFAEAFYHGCTNVVNLLLEKAPLHDIIHDIVKYPYFADKFLELYQEQREIVDWLDEDGRTVRQVACKECREVILFLGQYDLDDKPIYESPSCKIYNALDFGGREEPNLKQPRRVVAKFFEKEKHFENEMCARRKDDGSPRFSSEFVIPHLASYKADQNKDYAEACKIRWKTSGTETDLPVGYSYCVVMERGERNLLAAMNAENLSAAHKDLERRDMLQKLCKIFSHLHNMGYIHGDIKPHNVVRHLSKSVTWKAIDFDACTKIGDVVGLKLTTGSAPPEMLKITKEGTNTKSMEQCKAVLRQPGGDLDESDLVLADPSFDVWSYGILMYHLVTGRSFFHSDLQGNLDQAGLRVLAHLSQSDINERLESVEDVNARVLLSRILRLNPQERPSMFEIGKDYYFHPSDSPQGRQSDFFRKQVSSASASKALDKREDRPATGETIEANMGEIESFLSSKSEFSYLKLRDEDKDWSDKLLNAEVETFRFDKLEKMGEKPKYIDGDTIYENDFLRNLLSTKGPDYFMGLLVEYFELYEIMNDAHEVCQGIKANLVSDAKSLKGIFIKLFIRGKGLNDVVRATLFCNSIGQFKYVGRQLKERYGYNVYIKPPKDEAGAWPIPKLLIYGNRRLYGRCLSVEIQFSTIYMHLATHASNNHLVYEAIRESTGYLVNKDDEFHEFLQSLNQQHIDTEGFLGNQSGQDGRFEILVRDKDDAGEKTHSKQSESHYFAKSTGFILSGRIRCGDLTFRFMAPKDNMQQFSESSFVVNKSLTLLSSHSYWSEESFDLEGKTVGFEVSFKGRGLVIAGIGTVQCLHGTTKHNGGEKRCSVHVGRSKFAVRRNGIEEVFREKKLPNQTRAKVIFRLKDGNLSISFVGEDQEEIESAQVDMLSSSKTYYLYMRAPPGVHDVKFHEVSIHSDTVIGV